MKIIQVERLIDVGSFSKSEEWKNIETQIRYAILSIQWPPGSGSFTLYDEYGKERGKGNGVKPIKDACMLQLHASGWTLEARCEITPSLKLGSFDAACKVQEKIFCVEWETGNISSSHRSINKMLLGLQEGVLIGGALILPTRVMYRYLTDRVGNFQELIGYFPLWRRASSTIREGVLSIFAVEHDAVSKDVPKIIKGTDGRALA